MAGLVERQDFGRVRCLTLNRPPSNNLSLSLLESLESEVKAAELDSRVRAIVLASPLPKYFSAGLDLEELFSFSQDRRAGLFDRLISAHRSLADCPKPTVAAIAGYALLGGFVLALGCGHRLIAAETGRVALSEIRLGLSPTSPLIRLVFSMGARPNLLKELLFQGKTLRADEALEAGLMDQILPAEGFLEAAIKEAEKLAKLPPKAYAAIKASLRAAALGDEEALWQEGRREFERIFSGAEAQEGIAAMREKRRPRWE